MEEEYNWIVRKTPKMVVSPKKRPQSAVLTKKDYSYSNQNEKKSKPVESS